MHGWGRFGGSLRGGDARGLHNGGQCLEKKAARGYGVKDRVNTTAHMGDDVERETLKKTKLRRKYLDRGGGG